MPVNIYEVVSGCEEELPDEDSRYLFASAGVREKDETWVYARLQSLAADGRVAQISRGRWTITRPETPR